MGVEPTDTLQTSPATYPSAQLAIALVAETYPPEINGVAMTLGRLVQGLLLRGHRVQLVRPSQSPLDLARELGGLQEVLTRGLPIPGYDGLQFGMPAVGRLLKLWRAKRPDIVHVATEGPLGWSAVRAARQLGIPLTSSFHTNFHSYSGHYKLGLLHSAIERYLRHLHNQTSVTLVPTRALQTELGERGFRDVKVLSRGVDVRRFNPGRRSQALRGSWGASPDEVVVCHVGRLAREKNVDLVVRAFNALRAKLPSAKLLFVGDGPQRASLQQALPDAIFAGMRRDEDLAAHYASSDIFLFPSLTDTFGNVVTEAMASGLAVVSFNRAAAAELIVDGVNGRSLPEEDEAAFVQATLTLALQAQQREQMRERAVSSVARRDWQAIADSFVLTLRGVIAAQAPAVPARGSLVTGLE